MITYIPTLLDLFTHFKANVYDLPRHMVGTVDSKTTRVGTGRGLETLEQVEKTAGKNVVL